MKPIRTVGIANGGGDAPGLNAVIRAIVRAAINEHGMRVISAFAMALTASSGPKAPRR